jgi:hypothetical protein
MLNNKTKRIEAFFCEDLNKLLKYKNWTQKLRKFLNIKKKEDLEKIRLIAISRIYEDKNFLENFYKEFSYKIALAPSEVEKILSCTKTERYRWIAQGLLSVYCHKSISVNGIRINCPFFDNLKIYNIFIDNKVEEWRKNHKEEITKKRALQNRIVRKREILFKEKIKRQETASIRISRKAEDMLEEIAKEREEPVINLIEILVSRAYIELSMKKHIAMSIHKGDNNPQYRQIKIYVNTKEKLDRISKRVGMTPAKLINQLVYNW